jgi:hypothetical protein
MLLRPQADYDLVMAMIQRGRGDSEIARRTRIPRPTINSWRHGRSNAYHRRLAGASRSWRPHHVPGYCYLLGIYLGDGCVVVLPSGAARLLISLDSGYPRIIEAAEAAACAVLPDARVSRRTAGPDGTVTVIRVSHPVMPYVFPQHGPGRKHTREIDLTEWQRALTHAHPRELLRGLIHSDGCRTLNRFKTKLPSGRIAEYEYPRYFFSNLSDGIRGIFCEHCELLGIRWTQSNPRNISVSHRKSVALLDEFVGPKR